MESASSTKIRVPVPETTNRITGGIVDSAISVHRRLGPGLLESVYEECLVHELRKRGLTVARQVHVPIEYDGVALEGNLRLDLLVQGTVVVELKAVEIVTPLHRAQRLTYLRLAGIQVGLILNFNVVLLRDGIVRLVA